MFLHEIDSLWQQQAGYYTRERNMNLNAVYYVEIESKYKQCRAGALKESKYIMLNLYLTAIVVAP